jgi:hypothetical protein
MNDLNSWMELVKLVSWNFPGLETKELIQGYKGNALVKNIKRRYCYLNIASSLFLYFINKRTEYFSISRLLV